MVVNLRYLKYIQSKNQYSLKFRCKPLSKAGTCSYIRRLPTGIPTMNNSSNANSKLSARWLCIAIKRTCKIPTLVAAALLSIGPVANADIGATHRSLVSEFASFNTPGVLDGRVEAIAIDGDKVFVGGSFTQIHDPLSDEIIDQPYLFAYSKSSGDIIRDFDPVLNNDVFALETTGDGTGVFAGGVLQAVLERAEGFVSAASVFEHGSPVGWCGDGDEVDSFTGSDVLTPGDREASPDESDSGLG